MIWKLKFEVGAGLIALFAPLGMGWGTGKILGLFAGFNFLGFVLVTTATPFFLA